LLLLLLLLLLLVMQASQPTLLLFLFVAESTTASTVLAFSAPEIRHNLLWSVSLVHQNLPQPPLIRALVHQNLQPGSSLLWSCVPESTALLVEGRAEKRTVGGRRRCTSGGGGGRRRGRRRESGAELQQLFALCRVPSTIHRKILAKNLATS